MKIIICFFCVAGTLLAAPFIITDRSSDLPSDNRVYEALMSAADDIENQVNNGFLSETSRTNFNSAVARASSSPGSALWVDRASNPDRFVFGVGAQSQVFIDSPSLAALNFETNNSLPQVAGGATVALQMGLRPSMLGFGSPKRDNWFVYLSGLYFASKISTAQLRLAQIGVNAQYRLVTPRSAVAVKWGGITLTSGANYSSTFIGMNSQMNLTADTPVLDQTATVNLALDYQLGVQTSVLTIPMEISTNISLLYLFTVFLGAGADLNVGHASLGGSATGPVAASFTGQFEGSDLFSGTGSLDLDDGVLSSPSAVVGRVFGGVQFNVLLLKVAAQYNYLTNGSHGLGLICRAAL